MNRQHIAIATMTLARNDRDERLLLDALQRLTLDRWRVVVCDGGSRPAFVNAVAALTGFTVVAARTPGLVGQIQASIAAARALDFAAVLYSEPDKFEFFDEHLVSFVADAPDDPDVGIVLAARTPASFEVFPAIQRVAEGAFNRLAAPLIGGGADYLYGPFLMNDALAAHVETVRADLGWGWRPFLFAEAPRLGYRVAAIERDFPCPADPGIDDRTERIHRMRQLRQNLDGLLTTLT